jgi:glucose/arabinose dehydrogenase
MKLRTHLMLISGVVSVGLIGAYFYLASDDVAQQDITELMGKTPNLKLMRREAFPTVNIAKVIGWQGNAKPIPAAGLAVNAFADKLDHPRWMKLLPNGDILVAESTQPAREAVGFQDKLARRLMKDANGSTVSANRITLLRDADHDGVAEFRSVLLNADNGLYSPFGMELVGDTLYVANTNALLAFPYKLGDTKITVKGEKILDLPATAPNNHWTRNVIASKDGKSLYVSVGSNSNIGENGLESEKNRANILEIYPKDKKFRIYAAGLRNPNGMALDPINGYLWTTVNERDMLGSDGPPDYLAWVDEGAFFGWPWFYWGGYLDDRVQPEAMEKRLYSRRPEYALGPHTASMGLAFANKAKLGAPLQRGAFIGQHGSWNRSPASGYKVIFVPFNDRGFAEGKAVDVLTGFLNSKGEAQGRPAGVAVDGQGALLVADDSGNRIWRVSSAAPAAPKVAALVAQK